MRKGVKESTLQMLSKVVYKTSEKEVNSKCMVFAYQPKEPKELKKLKKF